MNYIEKKVHLITLKIINIDSFTSWLNYFKKGQNVQISRQIVLNYFGKDSYCFGWPVLVLGS